MIARPAPAISRTRWSVTGRPSRARGIGSRFVAGRCDACCWPGPRSRRADRAGGTASGWPLRRRPPRWGGPTARGSTSSRPRRRATGSGGWWSARPRCPSRSASTCCSRPATTAAVATEPLPLPRHQRRRGGLGRRAGRGGRDRGVPDGRGDARLRLRGNGGSLVHRLGRPGHPARRGQVGDLPRPPAGALRRRARPHGPRPLGPGGRRAVPGRLRRAVVRRAAPRHVRAPQPASRRRRTSSATRAPGRPGPRSSPRR